MDAYCLGVFLIDNKIAVMENVLQLSEFQASNQKACKGRRKDIMNLFQLS